MLRSDNDIVVQECDSMQLSHAFNEYDALCTVQTNHSGCTEMCLNNALFLQWVEWWCVWGWHDTPTVLSGMIKNYDWELAPPNSSHKIDLRMADVWRHLPTEQTKKLCWKFQAGNRNIATSQGNGREIDLLYDIEGCWQTYHGKYNTYKYCIKQCVKNK